MVSQVWFVLHRILTIHPDAYQDLLNANIPGQYFIIQPVDINIQVRSFFLILRETDIFTFERGPHNSGSQLDHNGYTDIS